MEDMKVLRCRLKLHDFVFYATREMGRLYESEKYLHNYALTYALGFVHSPYHIIEQVPTYQEDLKKLNEAEIYVTPAKPLIEDFALHTFKFADISYHATMSKTTVNKPSYGKAKELAPESEFEFFVFAKEQTKLPRWIRIGKWMSKCELKVDEPAKIQKREGDFIVTHPLNPLDLPQSIKAYDLISMPPVSLIDNVHADGEFLICSFEKEKYSLPAGMKYFVGSNNS